MSPRSETARRTHTAFISYSRSDGKDVAAHLHRELKRRDISTWQDVVSLEGGRDWWLQITDAIDHVNYLILVLTKNALVSQTVRKEWRYARQQGVCVLPILADPGVDPGSIPRWLGQFHLLDFSLAEQRERFYRTLDSPCNQHRVPFMVDDLPEHFVERPREYNELLRCLLNNESQDPVAITAALKGAGGFGKTLLARKLCHDEAIQEAFDDGILWVTLGEKPGNPTEKVLDLIETISGERPGFTALEPAVTRFKDLLADRDILFVIDDVWNNADLTPFLQGGARCARLITTRDSSTLPATAQRVSVDAMETEEALSLLCAGLPPGCERELRDLTRLLGEWALLISLANGVLRERVHTLGQELSAAIQYTMTALEKRGVTFFDARDPRARTQAVSSTIKASLDLLTEDEKSRYLELAVFPEDVGFPFDAVSRLWSQSAGLDEFDAQALCERLFRFSLLQELDLARKTLRIHDVVRKYLLSLSDDESRRSFHRRLLEGFKPTSGTWADMERGSYLWEQLGFHLIEAGWPDGLGATLKDLRFVATKVYFRKSLSVEKDFAIALEHFPDDKELEALYRRLVQSGHLLNNCETLHEVKSTLICRLGGLDELNVLRTSLERDTERPLLCGICPSPDLPSPLLRRSLSGHSGQVNACAISADCSFVVSASDDCTLRLWEVKTGRERFTFSGHSDRVSACAISPDGSFVVSASDDHTLKLWNAGTGTEVFTLTGHSSIVNSCAISADGSLVLSASADRTLKIWDSKTGTERFTLVGHTDRVSTCAISSDGSFAVSASGDRTVKVWDVKTGTERFTFAGHSSWVTACSISPDGSFLVSASWDNTLKLWDVKTGTELLTLIGHSQDVTACAISPDGSFIVSASADRSLRVWDAKSGVERLALLGHFQHVSACAISPDGMFVVSASWDSTLKFWDLTTGMELFTLRGHSRWVTGCAISPDGSFILSASADRSLKIWDIKPGGKRFTLAGHLQHVNGCAMSPDGSFVVSASADQTIKLWDVRTGTERVTLSGHSSLVTACAVSPDGSFVVSASDDCTLKLWDLKTGVERVTFNGHSRLVTVCVISPDGSFIASGSHDYTVRLWDVATGRERARLGGHTRWVSACAISPDGSFVVSASADRTLKVWDAATGAERFTLTGHFQDVFACAISPDGSSVVSASADRTLRVWDTRTGMERFTLGGHAGWVVACAFSPDGSFIVSASSDSTLRIWDSRTGTERFTLRGHSEGINAFSVSPDGLFVISASKDNSLKLWDAKTGRHLTGLRVEVAVQGCAFSPTGEFIVAYGGPHVYFFRLQKI